MKLKLCIPSWAGSNWARRLQACISFAGHSWRSLPLMDLVYPSVTCGQILKYRETNRQRLGPLQVYIRRLGRGDTARISVKIFNPYSSITGFIRRQPCMQLKYARFLYTGRKHGKIEKMKFWDLSDGNMTENVHLINTLQNCSLKGR